MGDDQMRREEDSVRYTIKELLSRIELRTEQIIIELKQKADTVELNALDTRVTELERVNIAVLVKDFTVLQHDVISLKADQQTREALNAYRKWLIGGTIMFVGSFSLQIFNLLRVMMSHP